VLDRLQHEPDTRHIPVHILSIEEAHVRRRRGGAASVTTKPVTTEKLDRLLSTVAESIEGRVKRLLIVEGDAEQRAGIVALIGNGDVQTTAVAGGNEGLTALHSERFDCMVLDPGLPDMSGFDLIEQVQAEPALRRMPIVVYSAGQLTRRDQTRLSKASRNPVVRDVHSPERLLDEVTHLLHRMEVDLPEERQGTLRLVRRRGSALAGRRVLVVDDDVRNLFALTALLEHQAMDVVTAESGHDAITLIEARDDIDVALVDVMMPGMDGYETITAIRGMPGREDMPLIAVTAKAMKGDRERCIEAGASDYIAKPVDTAQLLSLLQACVDR
jgi:CheY-like chemotaxis protein